MEALYIETGRGRLFLIIHAAESDNAPAILHIPAFAEEMNRCRNHVTRAARAIAAAGVNVVVMDPIGTGDSDGGFADLTVEGWRDDIRSTADWIRQRYGRDPVLWGHRLGATVALGELLAAPKDYAGLMLWSPVLSGELYLKQFLRIRTSANFGRDGESRLKVSDLVARLEAGETVGVGGYEVTPALAAGLRGLELSPSKPPPADRPCGWIDMLAAPDSPLAAPAAAMVDEWRAAHPGFWHEAVIGPAFWNQVEPEAAPALTDASSAMAERLFLS